MLILTRDEINTLYHRAIGQFYIQVLPLRGFAGSYNKMSYRMLKQGPALLAALRVVITHSGEIVNNRNFNANHLARMR